MKFLQNYHKYMTYNIHENSTPQSFAFEKNKKAPQSVVALATCLIKKRDVNSKLLTTEPLPNLF